ncbi:hypothetical protein HDV03_000593 [Kappamyces sp. JEL0829]|nr:hypothetical protein HDV03_000593 [Kappamyces sp. JEL0829]
MASDAQLKGSQMPSHQKPTDKRGLKFYLSSLAWILGFALLAHTIALLDRVLLVATQTFGLGWNIALWPYYSLATPVILTLFLMAFISLFAFF